MNNTTNNTADVTTALQQVIATAIANAQTRTPEIIAFQAIQQVALEPGLREQAIAAYRSDGLATLQTTEGKIANFLVSAIAEWADE